jgi:glycosyltransferase involved in cell wall biosynthesis
MTKSKKGIWITWEIQRRNKGISSALGYQLYEIIYNDPTIIRYIKSLIKTLYLIVRSKPEYVVAQNPSILLSAAAVFFKNIFGYTCVIDSHNAGLFPLENKNYLLNIVSKYVQKKADFTIVTNEELVKFVNKNGGRAIALPDKLPDLPLDIKKFETSGNINLAFVCSFSSDEPYLEVIEVGKIIPDNICIYITGNYSGKIKEDDIPSNVKLLGFVPDNDYWSLLSSVEFVMVLTNRENCLVCGAYEAVSLRKPMILSNTQMIMDYFSSGCVYTKSNVTDIRNALFIAIDNQNKLKCEVVALEKQLKQNWDGDLNNLIKALETY